MKGLWFYILSGLLVLAPFSEARAAETACAKVVMEIVQELTLERMAFDAKLVLTNNLPTKDLANVRVDVEIEDGEGNRKDEIFFVQEPVTSNISDVKGTGTVKAGTKAEVHWLIIPSPGAGGTSTAGVYYFVGATLTYTVSGIDQAVDIFPDRINVQPMPELYLDYFTPYQVNGDNPFTAEVEPPVPFPLAVRVMNDGYGPANKLKIDSAQPKIIENQQGLLIDFKLLGASVNDSPVEPTLTVDIGNLPSHDAVTAYWEMISTMSGRFAGFDVSFTHDSQLGGELTSLIKETNPHYLAHQVKVNLPGRDGILDYLAVRDVDNNPSNTNDPMALPVPDVIFESEYPDGSLDKADAEAPVTPVSLIGSPERPTPQVPEVDLDLDLAANPPGWIYLRISDPSQGLLELLDVVRSDGIHLDPHNFWVDAKLDSDFQPVYLLQFIDYRGENGGASGNYKLVYKQPDIDLVPPVTSLIFDGPAVSGAEMTYITPQTRIILSGEDNEGGSGVEAMLRKVTGVDDDYVAALPFSLEAGDYSLEYFSVDRTGNEEEHNTAEFTVDDSAPQITGFTGSTDCFSPQAPSGVATARDVSFSVDAVDAVPGLSYSLQVIDGGDNPIRTIEGTFQSGTQMVIIWDGRDDDGNFVPANDYTVQVMVSDGLDDNNDPQAASHTAISGELAVSVNDWFAGAQIDSGAGDQLHPAASGTRIVWQDKRNGSWDIYLKDIADGTVLAIATDPYGQERPEIDNDLVVWQDNRQGGWDIYGYRLDGSGEFVVNNGIGDQEYPAVSGDWIAWQDYSAGNWDIYMKNLATNDTIRITSHERDQVHPVLAGDILIWEDYRHGLGEIYQYDLVSGEETRLTVDPANQTQPVVFAGNVLWTDQRDGHKEIYRRGGGGEAIRLTYGEGERAQPSINGGLMVYTDYSAGPDDPNLNFLDLVGSGGGILTSNPARQEEPAIGDGFVTWQDNRESRYQIYMAELEVVPQPIEVPIEVGFNLVATGQLLIDDYTTAGNMILSSPEGLTIEKALKYETTSGQLNAAGEVSGVDFDLSVGSALHLYSQSSGTLRVAAGGETTAYDLKVGANHIGILSVPYGYKAFDMMNSVGLANIVSVRRYDNVTGLWQSAAVRGTTDGAEIVGKNFEIKPGDGLVVTMKNPVSGWAP